MFRMLRFVWDMFVSHKVRFLLTISGVVVGVASLVTLASLLYVGEGMLRGASTRASGDDVISVRDSWKLRQEFPNERRLGAQDLKGLKSSMLLGQTTFSARYGQRGAKAIVGKEEANISVEGVDSLSFEVSDLKIAAGRPLYPSDMASRERVAVIGHKVKEELPSLEVGGSVQIDGVLFQVVGLMEKQPTVGPDDGWNDNVLVPYPIYNLTFNPSRTPTEIIGKVTPPDIYGGMVQSFVAGVREMTGLVLLQDRKNLNLDLGEAGKDGSTEQVIFMTIKILIFLTTIFSMVVGGINIMNIMLVTVTERTQEIGIRRALGATKKDILKQFLAETLGVTLTGAVVGTLVALGVILVASTALTKFVAPWPFHIEWWSLGLGLGFSLVIGLIFGISPALRAARLDPVEALRRE